MKKILLLGILLALASIVQAQIPPGYLTQAQVDDMNFDSIVIPYRFSEVKITPIENEWTVWTNVWEQSLKPVHYPEHIEYQVLWKRNRFYYSEPDFFQCWQQGISTQVQCFETMVLSEWINKFLVRDWIHRQYLKSLQTGGQSMVSNALRMYFIP